MSKDMKLIMERWEGFIVQEQKLEPHQIFTIKDLLQYFKDLEPNKFGQTFGKYSKVVAAAIGGVAGGALANPVAGAAAGLAAEKVTSNLLSKLLTTSVIAFSNIDDSRPKPPGSAAFYFDMNDHLQNLFRHIETKGANINSTSNVEKEVFDRMQKFIIQQLRTSSYSPNDNLSDILGNLTADKATIGLIKRGDFSGKVLMKPVENT